MDTAEDLYQWLEAAAVSGEEIGLVVSEGFNVSELFLTVTRITDDYLFGRTDRIASLCVPLENVLSAYTKPSGSPAETVVMTDAETVIN